MKAYRLDDFKSIDDLRMRDEEDPKPQRGELLIRVHAVSLNFRDIAMVRDTYPVPHKKGLIPVSDGPASSRERWPPFGTVRSPARPARCVRPMLVAQNRTDTDCQKS
jgi:hypothetical protein